MAGTAAVVPASSAGALVASFGWNVRPGPRSVDGAGKRIWALPAKR